MIIKYYLIAFIAVIITAISQVLLKVGAIRGMNKDLIRSFFNIFTLSGYLLFFLVTLLNLYAFKVIPMKMVIVLLPFTFILVGFFSYLFLGEKISRIQIISSITIVAGIIVFNL